MNIFDITDRGENIIFTRLTVMTELITLPLMPLGLTLEYLISLISTGSSIFTIISNIVGGVIPVPTIISTIISSGINIISLVKTINHLNNLEILERVSNEIIKEKIKDIISIKFGKILTRSITIVPLLGKLFITGVKLKFHEKIEKLHVLEINLSNYLWEQASKGWYLELIGLEMFSSFEGYIARRVIDELLNDSGHCFNSTFREIRNKIHYE